MIVAHAAITADTATDIVIDDDPAAFPRPVHTLAADIDNPGHFMTDRKIPFAEIKQSVLNMQVSPTHTTGSNPYPDLTRRRLRDCDSPQCKRSARRDKRTAFIVVDA